MIRTSFLRIWRLARPSGQTQVSLSIWRQLALVAVAGIASVAIGQLSGRLFHLAWPIPTSGSILVALPRAIILLAVLYRINRFGTLTAIAVAELGTKLVFGVGGMWPMCLIVPLLGNFAGDLLWFWLRRLPWQRIKLMLTGATLCSARVLVALFFWSLLRPGFSNPPENIVSALACIVAINIALGMIGGLIVSQTMRPRKSMVTNGTD